MSFNTLLLYAKSFLALVKTTLSYHCAILPVHNHFRKYEMIVLRILKPHVHGF